jgi:hypothetical protein
VPQVLRFANYKKQQNILKYTSNIGRRTEIKTEESESSLIPTQQVISKLTANTSTLLVTELDHQRRNELFYLRGSIIFSVTYINAIEQ